MTERDVVLAFVGHKWRPAIVLERRGAVALVVCLTSKLHASESARIRISRRREKGWYRDRASLRRGRRPPP